MIYLPNANRLQAKMLAEQVKAAVESNKVMAENGIHSLSITINIGVLAIDDWKEEICENPKAHVNELFAAVDEALYQAKKDGRNRVVSTAL